MSDRPSVHFRRNEVFRSIVEPEIAEILSVCLEAAISACAAAKASSDWRMTGGHPGQYGGDVSADLAALAVLQASGYSVLSEESGLHMDSRELIAVLDPIDGSTNASRGLPTWCSSIAVLDDHGPLCGLVYAPVIDQLYWAARNSGGYLEDKHLEVEPRQLNRSIVFLNGHSSVNFGWAQYRALGSAALELSMVAAGSADAFVDLSSFGLAPWDYLAGELICLEAGVQVVRLQVEAEPNQGTDVKSIEYGNFPALHLKRARLIAASSSPALDELLALTSKLGTLDDSTSA